jgi:hypothetical protein
MKIGAKVLYTTKNLSVPSKIVGDSFSQGGIICPLDTENFVAERRAQDFLCWVVAAVCVGLFELRCLGYAFVRLLSLGP